MPADFEDRWGCIKGGTPVSHWLQKGPGGKVYSLCRMVREPFRYVIPEKNIHRRCGSCLSVLARSGAVNHYLGEPRQASAILKTKFAVLIESFMKDDTLGPRLYLCPKCRRAFEGMRIEPQLCTGSEDGSHPPTAVVELARKDKAEAEE